MIFGMSALTTSQILWIYMDFILNILFIFSGLHQICIGIEIANMETKERVIELNFRELSPM